MILGNSKGNNKGKKYIKLTGNEVASVEDKVHADEFSKWYGEMFKTLTCELIGKEMYDADIMTDTFLMMYDCIAFKKLRINSYKSYFYRAYYTNTINQKTKNKKTQQMLVYLDDPYNSWNSISDTDGDEMSTDKQHLALDETLATPDFDYQLYEKTVNQLRTEVLEYVRTNYNEMNASIFEMYMGTDISCTELSRRLNYPSKKVFNRLYEIKKDILHHFIDRKNELMEGI